MKFLFVLTAVCLTFLSLAHSSLALENPLSSSNNKVGIHILFPSELDKAAKLINSSNGDWGYVVIPIQSGDKDLDKWQNFMDTCRKLHVIPIIRLATEGDYFNTKVWRVPTPSDVLDFANFLNSLNWPTKNRYIIVYNEVNRGDEWGGSSSPKEYADLLSYAIDTFKSKSSDFFIISAGLDNAAATSGDTYDEYTFLSDMNSASPGIFDKLDALGSHSYPNPGFSQLPTIVSRENITSFQFEKKLISTFTKKDLPVFITETGWSQDVVGMDKAALFISSAFQTVWQDNSVVTVAPFLLQAGSGPFTQFSFLDPNGNPNAVYNAVFNLQKVKGTPTLNNSVLAAHTTNLLVALPVVNFKNVRYGLSYNFTGDMKTVLKWFLQLP